MNALIHFPLLDWSAKLGLEHLQILEATSFQSIREGHLHKDIHNMPFLATTVPNQITDTDTRIRRDRAGHGQAKREDKGSTRLELEGDHDSGS